MNNREQCRKEKITKQRLGINLHLNTNKANLIKSKIVFNTLDMIESSSFWYHGGYNSNITMGKVIPYNMHRSVDFKKSELTKKQKKARKASLIKKLSRKINRK